jgi:hypothetical protein
MVPFGVVAGTRLGYAESRDDGPGESGQPGAAERGGVLSVRHGGVGYAVGGLH